MDHYNQQLYNQQAYQATSQQPQHEQQQSGGLLMQYGLQQPVGQPILYQQQQPDGQPEYYQQQQLGGHTVPYPPQQPGGQPIPYHQQQTSGPPGPYQQQQAGVQLMSQTSMSPGQVYYAQQPQQAFPVQQQSLQTTTTTTTETVIERRRGRHRGATDITPQTPDYLPPMQAAPPAPVSALPVMETEEEPLSRGKRSIQEFMSRPCPNPLRLPQADRLPSSPSHSERGRRQFRGNPYADSGDNGLSSLATDMSTMTTTTTTSTQPGGRRRRAAAAQGRRELQAFDARIAHMLLSYSGSVCPQGYQYYRAKYGYLCGAGHHFVSDDEVDAMMDGLRPMGPLIDRVNRFVTNMLTGEPMLVGRSVAIPSRARCEIVLRNSIPPEYWDHESDSDD